MFVKDGEVFDLGNDIELSTEGESIWHWLVISHIEETLTSSMKSDADG